MFFARQPTDNWRGGSGTSSVIGLFFLSFDHFSLVSRYQESFSENSFMTSTLSFPFTKFCLKWCYTCISCISGEIQISFSLSAQWKFFRRVSFITNYSLHCPKKYSLQKKSFLPCTRPPFPSPPSFLIPYQSYCTAADLAEDESF